MTTPKRIERSRACGWRMPEGAVYVGRPTRWGNPYRIGDPDPFHCGPMTAADAVFWFRADLDPAVAADADTRRSEIRRELAGKDLVCWCRLDQPCHADVLLQIANAPFCEAVR